MNDYTSDSPGGSTAAEGTATDSSFAADARTGSRPSSGAGRPPLRRAYHGRMLAGVATGIANYLGVDATIVRIAFVIATLLGGAGVPAYLACLLLIPEEGSDVSLATDLIDSIQSRLKDSSAMSPSSAQSWTRRIRPGYYENMRVSDAERAEVADLLGRHYSDGRLDKQEFDERVARAMSAKTRGDLDGLFDDLPPLDSAAGSAAGSAARDTAGDATRGRPGGLAGPYAVGRRPRGRAHPVLIVAAAVILASLAWHGIAHIFFVPWLAIIALVLVVAYANRHSRRARR